MDSGPRSPATIRNIHLSDLLLDGAQEVERLLRALGHKGERVALQPNLVLDGGAASRAWGFDSCDLVIL